MRGKILAVVAVLVLAVGATTSAMASGLRSTWASNKAGKVSAGTSRAVAFHPTRS